MQTTTDIAALDTGDTLTGVEVAVSARRSAEVSILVHVVHWADLHGDHDGVTREHGATDEPGASRTHPDFKRLGGEGTPVVAEFATAELGVSLRVHPLAARSWLADGLDLRHRLTPLWDLAVSGAAVEVWVLRRIAAMTRHLDADAAGLIATGIARVLTGMPAPRLLEKVESLVMLADEAAAEDERQSNLASRFVTFNSSNQRGLKGLYAKLSAPDAIVGAAQVQRLAELLLAQDLASGIARKDLDSMGVARSRALGLLIAAPDTALALISAAVRRAADEAADEATDDGSTDDDGANQDSEDTNRPDESDSSCDRDDSGEAEVTGGASDPTRPVTVTSPVATVLHLHLSDDALQMLAHAKVHGDHPAGVGRLEGHGPMPLREALELFDLTRVTIRPVLDPWATAPADSYAFTGNLREAVHTRVPADVYPYGTNTTHCMDVDHTLRYDPDGPPGQTRLGNAGPMTRHHHRIKTHGPMELRQPVPGTYVWRTPHLRYRLTDEHGTHDLAPWIGSLVFSDRPDDVEHAALLLTTGLDHGLELEGADLDDWELIA